MNIKTIRLIPQKRNVSDFKGFDSYLRFQNVHSACLFIKFIKIWLKYCRIILKLFHDYIYIYINFALFLFCCVGCNQSNNQFYVITILINNTYIITLKNKTRINNSNLTCPFFCIICQKVIYSNNSFQLKEATLYGCFEKNHGEPELEWREDFSK